MRYNLTYMRNLKTKAELIDTKNRLCLVRDRVGGGHKWGKRVHRYKFPVVK